MFRRPVTAGWAATLAVVLASLAGPAGAQMPERGDAPDRIRVFLDCQSVFCDFDHLRREIGFVDWVRDRQVAAVHVLGTSRRTGSGGQEFTLAFIGRRRFAGQADTLRFVSNVTDTETETRDALTRTLSLGLIRYAARTPLGARLRVLFEPPSRPMPTEPVDDPWNYWVFNAGLRGSLAGESQRESYSIRGDFTASRVTAALKIRSSLRGRFSRDEIELDSVETFIDERTFLEVDLLTVLSLSSHWSAGVLAEVGQSTFSNRDLYVEAGPAVEYNIFPYDESTRRRITFRYVLGFNYFDYEERTIYGKRKETLAVHAMDIEVGLQQPWGEIFLRAEASQFLTDLAKHRLEFGGGLEFRLFRGLGVDVFGSMARVKDQVNLPAGDLLPAEILVRRRELGTEFEYNANVGFSYTFGSIFNNIVNPRF